MVEIGDHEARIGLGRTRVLFALMVAAMLFLLSVLWRLQVVEYQEYERMGTQTSMRVVREPGLRGRILDRTGTPLAENRAGHCIAIYMAEVRQDPRWARTKILDAVDGVVDEIGATLDLPRKLTRQKIKYHLDRERFLPLVAWGNLPDETIARYAERIGTMPGVDIHTRAVRHYPFDDMACHVVGFVGRGNTRPEELEKGQEGWHFQDEMKGRDGIERLFNDRLRGLPRERLITVDVHGYRFEDPEDAGPVTTGADVVLSLNHRLQLVAEEVLGEDAGAICVVDPANGDVLALATFPRFSLRRISPRFPPEYHRQLNQDKRRPFVNKAMGERYAPGSTFKPVVALAALHSGEIAMDHVETCNGRIMLGNQAFHCTGHHGPVRVTEALETSCNVFFYEIGRKIGYDRIQAMGSRMGLGQRCGTGLHESAGQLPTREAVRERRGFWAPGLTVQAAIGQGEVTATPLQMALVAGCIANGGTLYAPRLVREIRPSGPGALTEFMPPKVRATNLFRPGPLRLVREGMRKVVQGARGTARRARVVGLEYAGKTGTAQYGPRGNPNYRGWMIAYAPYRRPRVAVSVLVESTEEGSRAAADKMKELMERIGPYLGVGAP